MHYNNAKEDMPEIFRVNGFHFMFYANDHEPIHVHVEKDGAAAKFTLFPVAMVSNSGLKPAQVRKAKSIIEENQDIIAQHWNRFFNKDK